MKKIKIQLIGTFIYYKEVKLDAIEHDYFLSIANRIDMDLHEALLDPYFYFKLKLDKHQTYEDLNGISYFGLDINQFHQLEIFIDGQKKQKFNYNDLNSESVLFPLYGIRKKYLNTSNKLINSYHLFAKEKGLTNYTFYDEEVDLENKLSFNVLSLNNDLLITSINFNNLALDYNKRDTIIIEKGR
jgi:hypothetical protein